MSAPRPWTRTSRASSSMSGLTDSDRNVLLYTTPAFQQEMEVTGPVSLDIYVSSSAVDTDFTGKLVDVWPDGFSQNLTDGILRARYRSSTEKAELMNPGEVYRLTIEQ